MMIIRSLSLCSPPTLPPHLEGLTKAMSPWIAVPFHGGLMKRTKVTNYSCDIQALETLTSNSCFLNENAVVNRDTNDCPPSLKLVNLVDKIDRNLPKFVANLDGVLPNLVLWVPEGETQSLVISHRSSSLTSWRREGEKSSQE